jgi:hypothetical protein
MATPTLPSVPVNGSATLETAVQDFGAAAGPREPEPTAPIGLVTDGDVAHTSSWRAWTNSRRKILIATVVAIAVLALAGGGVAALSGGKSGPSYATEAGQLLTPVMSDNAKVAAAVAALSTTSGSQAAATAISNDEEAIQVAQQSLALLRPTGGTELWPPRLELRSTAKRHGCRRHHPLSRTHRVRSPANLRR